MTWTKFGDRFPTEEDAPSGRILITYSSWLDAKQFYTDWSINAEYVKERAKEIQDFFWMPIPLLPNQKPFWWKK